MTHPKSAVPIEVRVARIAFLTRLIERAQIESGKSGYRGGRAAVEAREKSLVQWQKELKRHRAALKQLSSKNGNAFKIEFAE